MWLKTVLFDQFKLSLSNPLSWGIQDWCLLTESIGGVDLVLVMVMVLFGVPFSTWIGVLSGVVEYFRGWLLVFYLIILEQGQMVSPAKKWRSFFLLNLLTRIEWVSSMIRGGNPQVGILVWTHTHSPQNIRQYFGTPSLDYYDGSTWECIDLRVYFVYFSSFFSHSFYSEWVISCHQILICIRDRKMFQLVARLC